MASYSTTLATAQAAALTNFSQRPDALNAGGAEVIHHVRTSYTLLGTEADTELLSLAVLPAGARVLPHLCRCTPSADPGTTLVLDIGTDGDADAFADGLTLSTGAAALFTAPAEPAAVLNDRRIGDSNLGSDCTVKAKFMSPSTLTAGVVLNFDIFYAAP